VGINRHRLGGGGKFCLGGQKAKGGFWWYKKRWFGGLGGVEIRPGVGGGGGGAKFVCGGRKHRGASGCNVTVTLRPVY